MRADDQRSSGHVAPGFGGHVALANLISSGSQLLALVGVAAVAGSERFADLALLMVAVNASVVLLQMRLRERIAASDVGSEVDATAPFLSIAASAVVIALGGLFWRIVGDGLYLGLAFAWLRSAEIPAAVVAGRSIRDARRRLLWKVVAVRQVLSSLVWVVVSAVTNSISLGAAAAAVASWALLTELNESTHAGCVRRWSIALTGLSFGVGQAVLMVATGAPRYFLDVYGSSPAVATFALLTTIGRSPLPFVQGMVQGRLPALANATSGHIRWADRTAMAIACLGLVSSAVLALIWPLVAVEITSVESNWWEPLLVLLSILLGIVAVPYVSVLIVYDRPATIVISNVVALVAVAVLGAALIPSGGLAGASAALGGGSLMRLATLRRWAVQSVRPRNLSSSR